MQVTQQMLVNLMGCLGEVSYPFYVKKITQFTLEMEIFMIKSQYYESSGGPFSVEIFRGYFHRIFYGNFNRNFIGNSMEISIDYSTETSLEISVEPWKTALHSFRIVRIQQIGLLSLLSENSQTNPLSVFTDYAIGTPKNELKGMVIFYTREMQEITNVTGEQVSQ